MSARQVDAKARPRPASAGNRRSSIRPNPSSPFRRTSIAPPTSDSPITQHRNPTLKSDRLLACFMAVGDRSASSAARYGGYRRALAERSKPRRGLLGNRAGGAAGGSPTVPNDWGPNNSGANESGANESGVDRDRFTNGSVAIRLWCTAPQIQHMGREPLMPCGEFPAGETGHYQ